MFLSFFDEDNINGQKIIAMGETIVPWLMEKIYKEPDHGTMMLLAYIVDDDTALDDYLDEEDYGVINKIGYAWQKWYENDFRK